MNLLSGFINTGLDDRICKSLDKTKLVQKEVQYKTKSGKIATRKQWVRAGEDDKKFDLSNKELSDNEAEKIIERIWTANILPKIQKLTKEQWKSAKDYLDKFETKEKFIASGVIHSPKEIASVRKEQKTKYSSLDKPIKDVVDSLLPYLKDSLLGYHEPWSLPIKLQNKRTIGIMIHNEMVHYKENIPRKATVSNYGMLPSEQTLQQQNWDNYR